jgi:hypothetical protein
MGEPKPSVPATTKALQAWQSELRHLEKRLEEWSNDLAVREEDLEQHEAAFASVLDKADDETIQRYADYLEDCGCTAEDAANGCDCPKCEQFRSKASSPTIAVPGDKGDEVEWLENLWKLKDGRRKLPSAKARKEALG